MMPDDDYSIVIIDKIIIDVIMLMQSSTIAAVGKRAELCVNVVCALATVFIRRHIRFGRSATVADSH